MESQTEPDNVGVTTRAVADDMLAIFGSSSRAVTVLPVARKPASARSAMPNRLILVVSAGTLLVTVAAGVYAGGSVIGSSVKTSAPLIEGRIPHPVERRELGTPLVTAHAIVAAPSSPPVPVPTPIRETPAFSGAPATAAKSSPLFRTPASSPAAIPVVHGTSSAIVLMPASSVPASVQRASCVDDSDLCLAPSTEVAEQRVADAYEQAVEAGVRPRDLRGYRSEWDRARGVAVEQPHYALRLYAMITSDLLNLADDADERNGVTER